MKESPEKIYLDERVASTQPAQPSQMLKNNNIKEVEYVRSDIVRASVQKAHDDARMGIGPEVVVQMIESGPHHRMVCALTNFGRMFLKVDIGSGSEWTEIDPPKLNKL